MSKKDSMNKRLQSTFLLSVIIPIIILMVLFSTIYFLSVLEREEENVNTMISSINQNIAQNFHELDNITNTFYLYNDVFKEVESLNNPQLYQYYDDLVLKKLENTYTISMTKHIYLAHQDIRSIVFFPITVNDDLGYLVGKKSSRLTPIKYYDYNNEDWFKEAVERNGETHYYAVHKTPYLSSEESVFSSTRAIISPDTGRIIGVVKIDVSQDSLIEMLSVLNNDSQDRISLVNESGESVLLAGSNVKEPNKSGFVIEEESWYLQEHHSIPKTDWTLVYQLSFNGVLNVFLLFLIITIIIILGVMWMSHRIYQRKASELVDEVNVIKETLLAIEQGDFTVSETIPRTEELKDITIAVNQMVERLKANIEREYLLVIEQQQAEFKALQSQINPHFLYNTLNGFIGLNRMGEVDLLEKAIINLTKLFRYTTDQQDFVKISEEIAFLEGYLELELLKHPGALTYNISIDESIKNYKIPKLLIQPFIENSITHGPGNIKEHIIVDLSVRKKDNRILIEIEDNGVGFDIDEVVKKDNSIGLMNTIERIKYFDTTSTVKINSKIDEGTVIKIDLIREEEKNDENTNCR